MITERLSCPCCGQSFIIERHLTVLHDKWAYSPITGPRRCPRCRGHIMICETTGHEIYVLSLENTTYVKFQGNLKGDE